MSAQDMTFAEFFAGIGLMRIGLEKAGWSVVFSSEIRKHLNDREGCELK